MNSIVIARYKEDISWVLEIPPNFEIFLYNKGDQISDPRLLKRINHLIARPNVGRESETYLFHMINNLAAGNGFTVFAQGDPFEHSPDFLRLLNAWQHWDDLQPLTWQWRADHNIPPAIILDEYERHLHGRLRVRAERFSLMTWNPTGFFDKGAYGTCREYLRIHGNLLEGTNIAAHFLKLANLNELAAEAQAHEFGVFCYGAIFAARNEVIKKLPLENKKRLHEASMGSVTYGYILERMWLHIFGTKFDLPVFPLVTAAKTEASIDVVAPSEPVMHIHRPTALQVQIQPNPAAESANRGIAIAAGAEIKDALLERIKDRDFYMISMAWRHHGGDPSLLGPYDVWAKSPMMWAESKPDFWLIYISMLLENKNLSAASEILSKYQFYHGDRQIENYLPIVHFALENGIVNDRIKKAAYVCECLNRNSTESIFEKLVQGKSVAIVGNGPSEINRGRGAEIDSHDIVIRFNNYATAGFERDYGSKTDIWVRGSGGDDIIDRVNVDEYKLIMWEADYAHFPIHFNDLDILYRYLSLNKGKCSNFDFETHYTLRDASGISFPSTGLVTVWKVYDLLGKAVNRMSLYGFSFQEETSSNSYQHYFKNRDIEDARRRSEVHFPAHEREFMRSLNRTFTMENTTRQFSYS